MIRTSSRAVFGFVALLSIFLSSSVFGRAALDTDPSKGYAGGMSSAAPAHCTAGHRVGMIELGVNNNGTFGDGFRVGPGSDFFTGESVPSCDYPKGSHVSYLFAAAFWIGAVVGRDTLVSMGADGWSHVREMFPDEPPFGNMEYRSIKDPEDPEFEDAISEEDYISVYTDTFTEGVDNDYSGRPHTPLNIEITEGSYAWSYSYAEDFVLFDYQIKNIGQETLEQVYMGIYVDADVCFDCDATNGFRDDLCGFLYTYPATYGACDYLDTVFIAWIADNDGDFSATVRAPHVTATRIVRTPSKTDSLGVSFNWWISNGAASQDFGPRHKKDLRDFRTGGLGTPEGDLNKYHLLSNGEFDYDQARTKTIQPTDTLWLYPEQSLAGPFANGFDTRYLLSFGPFQIEAGQTLPVSFAYVAGENLHQGPGNDDNLPDNSDAYYANLDFSDLATNSTWAAWIYDNPGVDTDGDDYFGKMRICCTDSVIHAIDTISEEPLLLDTVWDFTVCDTFYYEGDGVPDFRGAAPPPAPDFWLEPCIGGLQVRLNGLRSETTRDIFSREVDFEGYRVYIARDDRPSSFGPVASYDLQDYNKFVYNAQRRPTAGYELRDVPFTLEELQHLYGGGDPTFDPLKFNSPSSPFVHPNFPESLFYFEAQDYNVSELGITTPIRKIYPNQPYPSALNPDSAMPEELTEDGHLKYFEYELMIEDLLPTVPYWVNVTAFDFGSPESGLASLETSVSIGYKVEYALSSWDDVKSKDLKVYVYPNPYVIDGEYRNRGFEGRIDTDRPPDRTREIHFANLPPKCTIRIYTLDGDLVRELRHDKPVTGVMEADETTTHHTWNMITRNTQMVVSGLYYWTVEAENGETQIGTLAIIM